MSAEGENNLDNDTAQDLLYEVSLRLSETILSLFEHPLAHDCEDEPIGKLFAWIEVFFALHEAGLISAVPDVAQIQRYTVEFVLKWEANHREIGNAVPLARKESILETFSKLNAVCKEKQDQAIIFHEVGDKVGVPEDAKTVLDILNSRNKK